MSQEQPIYLIDLTLSAFAPDPVEPPPANISPLNLLPLDPGGDSPLSLQPSPISN